MVTDVINQSFSLICQKPRRTFSSTTIIWTKLRTTIWTRRPLLLGFSLKIRDFLFQCSHPCLALSKLNVLFFQILLELFKLGVEFILEIFVSILKCLNHWYCCHLTHFLFNIMQVFYSLHKLVSRVLFVGFDAERKWFLEFLESFLHYFLIVCNEKTNSVLMSLINIFNSLLRHTFLYHFFSMLNSPKDFTLIIVNFLAKIDFYISHFCSLRI